MRKLLQKIWYRLFSKSKLRKIENDRAYNYKSISIVMEPGVFHPKYFDSSQLLLEWVEGNEVAGKNLIEVGCGSGIASLRAAQKGANVWAIDVNLQAVRLLLENAQKNQISLEVIQSDLFENVPNITLDFALINPPFYPKNPTNEAEHAWYCGEGFDYFHQLFEQLQERQLSRGIFMTLSDGCDLTKIRSIASQHGYFFHLRTRKKSFFETNFLFELYTAQAHLEGVH